ncbi:hypothetical protein DFJ63DRAFT_337201 [Scheffersomyces coipomensis]|uniref:uncharacterized protein n=1 Tax=Scheffersomyces coipomensis TaxID=1788519 RepID=UPI00315DB2B5
MKQSKSKAKSKSKSIKSKQKPKVKPNQLVSELKGIFAIDKTNQSKSKLNVYKRKQRKKQSISGEHNDKTELFKATSTPFTSLIIEPLKSNKIEEIQNQIRLSKEVNKIHNAIQKKKTKKKVVKSDKVIQNQIELQVADSLVEMAKGGKANKEMNVEVIQRLKASKVEEKKGDNSLDNVEPFIKQALKSTTKKQVNQKVSKKRKAKPVKPTSKAKSKLKRKQSLTRSTYKKEAFGPDPINLLGISKYRLILRKIS